ncbi:hypothetical protein [Lacibacter sp. H407]|uniref:hypothetical protein n=1 Tax=Lacibacter sp. H407 TaxID=3133423 RepID=UPI0030C59CF3
MEENKPLHNEEEKSPPSTDDSPQQDLQLNVPSTDEANAEAEQPITLNLPPVTEQDMEVHHHAHDPAAPHHKKNWKSYFWEFLMLFLAVFCGFLAEYQLEHKIEKDRAVKFMHDMVENLKYDTARCGYTLNRNVEAGLRLDSFRTEIFKAIQGNIDGNRLYELWYNNRSAFAVTFNEAAITQLKNSGHLRLINNDSLVNKILTYYERKVSSTDVNRLILRSIGEEREQVYQRFFNFRYMDELLKEEWQMEKIKPDSSMKKLRAIFSSNPPLRLLKESPEELQVLYNSVARYEDGLKNYNAFLRWTKESAEQLIGDINQEYHFKK